MVCSPVGLNSSMDRAWHTVIAKVGLQFPVTPELFQILFKRLGLLFNCEDHLHFQYPYAQFKI